MGKKFISYLKRFVGICFVLMLGIVIGYVFIPKIAFQVHVEHMVLNVGETFENQFRATLWGKDVTDQVVVQQNVYNTRVGSYEVTYLYDDGKREYKCVKTVKIKDKIAPEITLVGESEIEVVKGSDYLDAGYYAMDNYDGDITGSVIVSGEVDVNKVGNYAVTYTVVDSSKNKSKIKRKIVVVDSVPVSKDDCDSDTDMCKDSVEE